MEFKFKAGDVIVRKSDGVERTVTGVRKPTMAGWHYTFKDDGQLFLSIGVTSIETNFELKEQDMTSKEVRAMFVFDEVPVMSNEVKSLRNRYVRDHDAAVTLLKAQRGCSEKTRRFLCACAMVVFNDCHKGHRRLLELGA